MTKAQIGCWRVCSSLTILYHSALFKEAVFYGLYQPVSSEAKLPTGFIGNRGEWLRRWMDTEGGVSHPRLPSCGVIPLSDPLALPSGSLLWLQLYPSLSTVDHSLLWCFCPSDANGSASSLAKRCLCYFLVAAPILAQNQVTSNNRPLFSQLQR